jgi:Protein of unknown function DUF58
MSEENPDSWSQAFSLLRNLEWRVKRRMEAVVSGEYRSAFRGRGMEFDQVVPYEFGDDVRDIDWNVTAKLGQPYRKKYVEEREMNLVVLFEDTSDLDFGSGSKTKRQALLEMACIFMLLGAANRDRVWLAHASSQGVHFSKEVRGRGKVIQMAHELLQRPSAGVLSDTGSKIDWRYFSSVIPRHSVVVWLGNFMPTMAPSHWGYLNQRLEWIGCRVDDLWDRELPTINGLPVYDPNSEELVLIDGNSRSQREAHAEWVKSREDYFVSLFPKNRSRLTFSNQEEPLDAVIRLMRRRMEGRS